jgi:hypothetical protein
VPVTAPDRYPGRFMPAWQAKIYMPADAQFEATGNLYICDCGNQRIRRVDAVTGLISTVAGNGQTG